MTPLLRVPVGAALYFGAVFSAGFALGVLRTLWLEPQLGPLAATALELPVMFGVSWIVARRIGASRFRATRAIESIATGALAFGMLMAAELVLSDMMRGTGLAGFLAHLTSLHGALGLAGQLVFALIPWLQFRLAATRP